VSVIAFCRFSRCRILRHIRNTSFQLVNTRHISLLLNSLHLSAKVVRLTECFCMLARVCSLSLSLVPQAQCPLVSMTYFIKWLHFLLSIANPCRVQISLLHQSTKSSVHLLLGLPLFLPTIMPKTACLTARILDICPGLQISNIPKSV